MGDCGRSAACRRYRGHGESGAVAVPLTVAVIVLMVALGGAIGDIGGRVVARVEAQSAADAAALAGVTGGRDAASAIARANGAILVEWRRSASSVAVVVAIDGVVARASATDTP